MLFPFNHTKDLSDQRIPIFSFLFRKDKPSEHSDDFGKSDYNRMVTTIANSPTMYKVSPIKKWDGIEFPKGVCQGNMYI